MSKNLKDIVDLEKYPIHDLNSPKIKKIIEKCKVELDQDSCSTLPDFILPNSLFIIFNELGKIKSGRVEQLSCSKSLLHFSIILLIFGEFKSWIGYLFKSIMSFKFLDI